MKKKKKGIARKRSALSQIKSTELTINVKTIDCPIHTVSHGYPFDYRFVDNCSIETCQYHSNSTAHSCMLSDITMPNGNFTDMQLYYFKLQNNNNIPEDQKPKPRTVNLIRKKSITSVKANLLYYYYVEYIKANYIPEDTDFVYQIGMNKMVDQILGEIPFNQPEVKHFRYWMLPFLFDRNVYKKFCCSTKTLLTEAADFNLQTVLNLTPVRFIKIQKTIKEMAKPGYQKALANSLF